MARKGIQEYRGTFVERAATEVRNTSSDSSSNLKGDGRTGRFDMGGMLGWSSPCREVFRQFLAHPNLVPYLHLFPWGRISSGTIPHLYFAKNQAAKGFHCTVVQSILKEPCNEA